MSETTGVGLGGYRKALEDIERPWQTTVYLEGPWGGVSGRYRPCGPDTLCLEGEGRVYKTTRLIGDNTRWTFEF